MLISWIFIIGLFVTYADKNVTDKVKNHASESTVKATAPSSPSDQAPSPFSLITASPVVQAASGMKISRRKRQNQRKVEATPQPAKASLTVTNDVMKNVTAPDKESLETGTVKVVTDDLTTTHKSVILSQGEPGLHFFVQLGACYHPVMIG